MKAFALLALLTILAGCSSIAQNTDLTVGQYYMPVLDDEYAGDGLPIEVCLSSDTDWRCELEGCHLSHLLVGWPGDGRETEINRIGFNCKVWRQAPMCLDLPAKH